MIILALFSA
jgi:hypothetical protein